MNLLQLRQRLGPDKGAPDHIELIQPQLNGGKVTREQIAALDDAPQAMTLTISGLDQGTFELLVTRYAQRFVGINFWKCPRVQDLTPLEDLPALRCINYYWNQKATRLWNFKRTPGLTGLRFDDFTKLVNLGDLKDAQFLQELEFGNAVSTQSEFESLKPLSALSSLKSLAFNAKKIRDARIEPLASLGQLQTLAFPANLFTTAQVAWLRARLPSTVDCATLAASCPIRQPVQTQGKTLDTVVVGAKKPMLDSTLDAKRLRRYQDEFAALLQYFEANPQASPESPVPG